MMSRVNRGSRKAVTQQSRWHRFCVGILGIIIGSFIAIVLYRKQRVLKEITYQTLSDAPIANIDKRVQDKVKIIYEDNGVRNEINEVHHRFW